MEAAPILAMWSTVKFNAHVRTMMSLMWMVERAAEKIFAQRITEDVSTFAMSSSIDANVIQDLKHSMMAKPVKMWMNVFKIMGAARSSALIQKVISDAHASMGLLKISKRASATIETNVKLTMEIVTMSAIIRKDHTCARAAVDIIFPATNTNASI